MDNWVEDIKTELVPKLSPEAKVYLPGSGDFDTASARWSALGKPVVNAAISAAVAQDVVETVGPFIFRFSSRKFHLCDKYTHRETGQIRKHKRC